MSVEKMSSAARILFQANGDPIHALVATARFLLLVDLAAKKVTPLECHRPEYYGISWFPGGTQLVLSHSNIDNAELKSLSDYATSEQGMLSYGDRLSPKFLSQPHQILCAPDGRVICTNTGRNAITVFDFNKPNTFQEVRISELRWDRLSSDEARGDHLNSVFLRHDRLYAVAHGHWNGSRLATLTYPELDLVSLEPIKAMTGLHNIWVTASGAAITCHSEAGSLVDVTKNEVLWSSGSAVYLRGLAASSEFVLVGESQKSARDLRRSSWSGLWLIDRTSWRPIDYYCLGPYGAVHEVRLLDVADEAHHGSPFSGLGAIATLDARKQIASQRLLASQLSYRDRNAWSNFDVVFGAPVPGEEQARSTEPGQLCLLTQPRSAGSREWKLSFRYILDYPNQESHVAVVNYRGMGGDTDMHAILIQAHTETAGALSLWKHDGMSWTRQPGGNILDLPLTANVHVRTAQEGVELKINDRAIHVPAASMPMDTGVIGLRFMGATVYPSVL